jgi:hypothetical protein
MGLSSSKTKTKSTTSSTPLDQYAPYINQGLASAQGVFDANQGNLGAMSQSAYGLYNDLAKSIGADGGFVGNAQNVAANIYGGANQGHNPGAATYSRLQGANDPSIGLLNGLAQGAGNNPALGLLQGMTAQSANPDSAQFYKDTLSGKYLNANPYLDSMVAQSDAAATKALNQRFAAAGMGAGLSTPYADLLSRNLADSENKLRYGAYNDELNRMGTIGGQSDAQYNATQDRSLNAATGLGNLYHQTDQLKLAAAQAMGQQQTADNTTALNAAGAADTQYNQQIAQQLQALGLVPELTNAQYAGVSPALAALQSAASIPYTGINNYAGLVNGLTGKYGNQTTNSTTTESGNIGQMVSGLAGSALSGFLGSTNFADLLKPPPSKSDIRAKRDVRKLGTLDDGLGVYAYRYLWDDQPQIGVMAQEVAALRPWALGPIQDGYMTVDYGAL